MSTTGLGQSNAMEKSWVMMMHQTDKVLFINRSEDIVRPWLGHFACVCSLISNDVIHLMSLWYHHIHSDVHDVCHYEEWCCSHHFILCDLSHVTKHHTMVIISNPSSQPTCLHTLLYMMHFVGLIL